VRTVAPRHSECFTTSATTAAYIAIIIVVIIIVIIIVVIIYRKCRHKSATIRRITGPCRAPPQGDYTIVTMK